MIIQSKRVWIQEQWIPAQLTLDGGRITAISAVDAQKPDIDYGNLHIMPGFIDTHCHGAFGFDTNDADPNGLQQWLLQAPQEGLTIVCPTTITQSEAVLTQALRNVATIAAQNPKGARIGGVHFEGPYLNVAYKGAQPEPFIVKPDLDQFRRYQEASGHRIKVMTMAAENDANFELTRYASADGVFVNLGHSASTYDEAVMAFANGASGLTHTFNAMTPFNHRQPGLVGAALRLGDAYAEIISDGNHVSWPAINVLFKAKGKDRCVMITDALCVKGVTPGQYIFGGQTIDVRPNGGAYLSGSNTLAGSTLTYNAGLRNLIEHARVDEVSAINACTTNPAHVLGLGNVTGKIKVHFWADLTVLDDDYAVQATYVNGERIFTV